MFLLVLCCAIRYTLYGRRVNDGAVSSRPRRHQFLLLARSVRTLPVRSKGVCREESLFADSGLEYHHLSTGLQVKTPYGCILCTRSLSLENPFGRFRCLQRRETEESERSSLSNRGHTIGFAVSGLDVRRWLNWPRALPLEDERARLLREVPSLISATHVWTGNGFLFRWGRGWTPLKDVLKNSSAPPTDQRCSLCRS